MSDTPKDPGRHLPSPASCDWTEDFRHENGNYVCVCGVCNRTFHGHKRRTICKGCIDGAESLDFNDSRRPGTSRVVHSSAEFFVGGLRFAAGTYEIKRVRA